MSYNIAPYPQHYTYSTIPTALSPVLYPILYLYITNIYSDYIYSFNYNYYNCVYNSHNLKWLFNCQTILNILKISRGYLF
nr:MAG TPA: hypothetical protein [Caudoviricetes sp.]